MHPIETFWSKKGYVTISQPRDLVSKYLPGNTFSRKDSQSKFIFTYLGHCVLCMNGHVSEHVLTWRYITKTKLFRQFRTMHVRITIRPLTTHKSEKVIMTVWHENTQLQTTRLITWKHTECGTRTHTPSNPRSRNSSIQTDTVLERLYS